MVKQLDDQLLPPGERSTLSVPARIAAHLILEGGWSPRFILVTES